MTAGIVAADAVHPGSFMIIVVMAAAAATTTTLAGGRGIMAPVVVLELLAGVLIGPQVLGVQVHQFTTFFSDLGLAMLFFFVGYEIELDRIKGLPLRLAAVGWVLSLALAYGLALALVVTGVVISALYTGSAFTTTSLGTLLPILSDSGELRSRFGTFMLAAGAAGEFGPILLITLVLSAQRPLHNALILLAFIAAVLLVGLFAIRSTRRTMPLFERTLETSPQLAVRWIVVLIVGLVLLAYHLGLDLLLGGFAAGMITRLSLGDREAHVFESKLTAIGYGVFVPFFFIVSGMNLDVSALFSSIGMIAKMLLFLCLFLVVRGVPALAFYRQALGRRDRIALGLMSSAQLPLVLAITAVATADGYMRQSTAAALIGGAVLTTLVFPVLAVRVRGDTTRLRPDEDVVEGPDPIALEPTAPSATD